VLPDDVDPRDLDPQVRQALRTLTPPVADRVAKHLVMAGTIVDEDPEAALGHARAARRLGGRLALVREAVGITAYLAGEWAEALNELRAARRIGGENTLVHVMADCERALGRAERALELIRETDTAAFPVDLRVELAIVEGGARRDLGQFGAAVLALQGPQLRELELRDPELRESVQPWAVRLAYAYADALAAAGRAEEAAHWFAVTRDVDEDVVTDAADRLATVSSSE